MAAKKRASKKASKKKPAVIDGILLPPHLTAIKLVAHRASDGEHIDSGNGLHRYVITGLLVSTKKLDNFPKDYDGSLVLEDVEQGTFGLSLVSLLHTTLGGMKTRPSNCQGCSADQSLVRLRDV